MLQRRSLAAAPAFADKSSIGTENSDDEPHGSGNSYKSKHAIVGKPYRPKLNIMLKKKSAVVSPIS